MFLSLTPSVADQSRLHHFMECLWKLEFRTKWLGRLAALSSMEFSMDSDKNVYCVHINTVNLNLVSQISHKLFRFIFTSFFKQTNFLPSNWHNCLSTHIQMRIFQIGHINIIYNKHGSQILINTTLNLLILA